MNCSDLGPIIHLRLGAFYTSLAEQDQPSLRGKPFVIGGLPHERASVLGASPPSLSCGVRPGMPLRTAYLLCPQAAFLPPDQPKYEYIAHRTRQVLSSFTPLVEPAGLGEAFLDVAGCQLLFGYPLDIAKEVKKRISQELGVTASLGIASSKLVAKVASSLGDPDGLVAVPKGGERDFLAPLSIEALWQVGDEIKEKLKLWGLRTIGQVAQLPEGALARPFGEKGRWIHCLANGVDDSAVRPPRQPAAMEARLPFEGDVRETGPILPALRELAESLGARLRASSLQGRLATIKIEPPFGQGVGRQALLKAYTDDAGAIYERAKGLLIEAMGEAKACQALVLGVGGLAAVVPQQHELLYSRRARQKRLGEAIAFLQERYGGRSVLKASLREDSFLPERLAVLRPASWEGEDEPSLPPAHQGLVRT